jgi:hypothetical protein
MCNLSQVKYDKCNKCFLVTIVKQINSMDRHFSIAKPLLLFLGQGSIITEKIAEAHQ